ncbi:MAG: hypothetical protein Q7T71_02735 [Herbiconiux sp.]|nr:hypothetical protein [Herbiconiux sp.]
MPSVAYAPPAGASPAPSAVAVASVVLGAVALIVAFVPVLNYGAWLLAAGGLVLGVVALARRLRGRGLAIAGTTISPIALALSVILAIAYTAGLSSLTGFAGLPFAGAPASEAPASGGASGGVDTIAAGFGQTVTYDDGLQVSIAEPTAFEPSAEARGASQEWNLTFAITFYNGTDAELPLRVSSAVSASGIPADVIVDGDNALSGVPPVASIAPGQTISYVEGYSVADATAVTFDIAPGAEYLPSRFSG